MSKKRKYEYASVDLAAIADSTGIAYQTLHYRYTHGLPLDKPTVRAYRAFEREQTMSEWASELGVEKKLVYDRLRYYTRTYRMDDQEALEFVLRANAIYN